MEKERLEDWCPLYAKLLRTKPEYAAWLSLAENRDWTFSFADFKGIWESEFATTPPSTLNDRSFANTLRRFRRKMCLRIAYRSVNGLAPETDTLKELTFLAEFCLQTLLAHCRQRWETRLGVPWDTVNDRPARFCVVGLGKFGGRELNFCSDVDLIFVYDGEGECRRPADSRRRGSSTANSEFFARLASDFTATTQASTADGFLYNVDLRLRPEGKSGPLVRSLTAMEHYYYVAGQTWERLAWIKARPVAGDAALGDELLEILNPFRFPRARPPFLLESIAGVKIRTEREVTGAKNLQRDIKNGPGGIREVEFFVQAMQMLIGGKNPFVQTPATLEALQQLERYSILTEEQAAFLEKAYLALRRVENLLQMREEKQTHRIPEDTGLIEKLAHLLGHESTEAFNAWLEDLRSQVHENYRELFGENDTESEIQEWTTLLGGEAASPAISSTLEKWFPNEAEDAPERIRQFVLGTSRHVLTREHVEQFLQLARSFDQLLPQLSRPLEVLGEVAKFGKAYGASKQFFKACNGSPRMFRALCLLFDRSLFIYELLSRHPEIIEEVLGPGHRQHKMVEDHHREIGFLPQDDTFARWLWFYVKAEQVRIAIGSLLGEVAQEETEIDLSNLADAAVGQAVSHTGAGEFLAFVALGKHGGRELTFGSDLDMIVLGNEEAVFSATSTVREVRRILEFNFPPGRTFEVDLRLRPHGRDGPQIVTLHALRKYHQPGGGAQLWERMVLTRARPVAGNPSLIDAFLAFREETAFGGHVPDAELQEIGRMRRRIEEEKGRVNPPQRAFKAGRGGLVDIEFLCQRFQLSHGHAHDRLRAGNTRKVLAALGEAGLVDSSTVGSLLRHHHFLRMIEHAIRRYDNQGKSVLDPKLLPSLAVWLEMKDGDTVMEQLRETMNTTRRLTKEAIGIDTFPD